MGHAHSTAYLARWNLPRDAEYRRIRARSSGDSSASVKYPGSRTNNIGANLPTRLSVVESHLTCSLLVTRVYSANGVARLVERVESIV